MSEARRAYTATRRCPVCGSWAEAPGLACRGWSGKKASGEAWCTRLDRAGGLALEEDQQAYRHRLRSDECDCGLEHAVVARADAVLGQDQGREGFSDLGNARRLVRLQGPDWRHVKLWGGFLHWDGARWQRDETLLAETAARAVVKDLWRQLGEERNGQRAKLREWVEKSESAGKLNACVELFRSEPGMGMRPDDFDQDPWLLNVPNGTLDLRTGSLREARREDWITKLAAAPYQAEAPAPVWEAFLERVLAGSRELADYVRRLVGYAITGETREHVLAFLYGTGRNGKSTFLETLVAVLGDYARPADPQLLLDTSHEQHPTNVADLKGARLVTCMEVGSQRRLDEAKLKVLTGGDTLKARFMRGNFFEFRPSHTILMAGNHKPAVWDNSPAFWERMALLPFTVYIPPGERDPALKEKLLGEGPGILAWAVRGCREWQERGLDPPAEVRAATAQWREDVDLLGPFLEERCLLDDPARETPFRELAAALAQWTGAGAHISDRTLARLLDERNVRSRKRHGTMVRIGIGLRGAPVQTSLATATSAPPDGEQQAFLDAVGRGEIGGPDGG